MSHRWLILVDGTFRPLCPSCRSLPILCIAAESVHGVVRLTGRRSPWFDSVGSPCAGAPARINFVNTDEPDDSCHSAPKTATFILAAGHQLHRVDRQLKHRKDRAGEHSKIAIVVVIACR